MFYVGVLISILVTCFLYESAAIDQPDHQKGADETIFDTIYRASLNQPDPNDGTIRVELDIKLTPEQYDEMYNNHDNQRMKRYVRWKERHIWTNNLVPYYITPNTFNTKEQGAIKSAMAEWAKMTCVRFRQVYSPRQTPYMIRIVGHGGCMSGFGKAKYGTVHLGNGCRFHGTVLHELGHALGFAHQQARQDRDKYVTILQHNISPFSKDQFSKMYNKKLWTSFGVPYDYYSIMHYNAHAFTKNGQKTIITRNGAYDNIIGKVNRLSFGDIKIANLLYKCGKHCGIKCPYWGFADKYCRCVCPTNTPKGKVSKTCGSKPTTSKPRPVTSRPRPVTSRPRPGVCKDKKQTCNEWGKNGYCVYKYVPFMKTWCKKTCGHCGGVCNDKKADCTKWAQYGNCIGKSHDFMKKTCKKSCGHCGGPITTGCRDKHAKCKEWYSKGHCRGDYRQYMKINCAKTCRWC